MSTVQQQTSLSDYQLRLTGFEGPLDVLLRLIERERLEISTLSLVAVTDQFLDYVARLDDPPPRLLAEFATIASRLLVLKSRALLPRAVEEDDDEDVDDLTERLREYQRAKQLASTLRDRQEIGWRAFTPRGAPPNRPVNVRLQVPDLQRLRAGYLRAVARQPEEPQVAPIRHVVSVVQMTRRIVRAIVGTTRRVSFSSIVNLRDRGETVAGFVAVLALWSRDEIALSQDQLFGEIEIERSSGDSQR